MITNLLSLECVAVKRVVVRYRDAHSRTERRGLGGLQLRVALLLASCSSSTIIMNIITMYVLYIMCVLYVYMNFAQMSNCNIAPPSSDRLLP